MAKVLADLPENVLSRSEEFLNVMVGRSQDLNSLPVPESRIEEYLEYLAYNNNIGDGEGSNGTTITSMHFNAGNGNLSVQQSDGSEKTVDLSGLQTAAVNTTYNNPTSQLRATNVQEALDELKNLNEEKVGTWGDLNDTDEESYVANLTNTIFGGMIEPGILDANGGYRPNNSDWVNVRFKVKPGHTYRLTHANSSSTALSGVPTRCSLFNNDNEYVSEINWNNNAGTAWGNRKYAEITIPVNINNTVVYGSCNLRITGGFNEREELMIWDISESSTPTEYVELKKGGVLIGNSVDRSFVSLSGLTSSTVNGALDELNGKVVELEVATQMYSHSSIIGEMKQLAYDAGDTFNDGTNTWLRANGQAINSIDYPELCEKFTASRVNDDIEVSIPSLSNEAGYYYICAK